MPLLFAQLCDLLSALEDLLKRDPPLLQARLRQRSNATIKSWFRSHRVSINSSDVDAVALLSALFPAKRTDRVYGIQPPRLTRSLRRWLLLGSGRWPQLDQWQQPGRGDLGECVERVLKEAELPQPHSKDWVTLEQIDNALATVAAQCRFSAPRVRARQLQNDVKVGNALENIYQRLQSREAKWFTRTILKDLSCLDRYETLVYTCIDPRLRVAMQMYHDFESAISELKNLPASQMSDADQGGFTQHCANDAHLLLPRIGVKVGAPKWLKAKGGVRHAVSIINGRTMSVEKKHDGEYCQIHIDLLKGEDCIQIFSKSGKDSTQDRMAVHQAIKNGLRIGRRNCGFSEKCILEGELLVWSARTKEILEFHKIRKHVTRSGSFLGTALDSQPHPWEHLMIMFYDVMLIDQDPVLHKSYQERRRLLEKLVERIEGRSDCTWQTWVRFSKPEGPQRLKKALALAFVRRWEGLVLKAFDEPYFDLARPVRGKFSSRWVKLKKDCIEGLGDTADFAVIGGGYDVGQAAKYPGLNLRWTHFYIACLRNKEEVLYFGAKPRFFVFDKVSDCIKKEDMKTLNENGYLRQIQPDSSEALNGFDIEFASGLSRMKEVFKRPFVFDIAGSGFDKSPDRDIFTLRFPRVMRVHWDRDWREAVDLVELRQLATEARSVPSEGIWRDELATWMASLDQIDRGTNGQLNSWDYSDDEEDDFELYTKEVSTISSLKPIRRLRTHAGPPLVRMDTGEMRDKERRLSSGEIAEWPTSKQSMTSVTSEGSLQTPPTSSPISRSNDGFVEPILLRYSGLHSHQKSRKRSTNIVDLEETSRRLKKARPEVESRTKASLRNTTRTLTGIQYEKLLGEIRNSTHPLPPSRVTEPIQRNKSTSTEDFSLVRKLPIGPVEHYHQRHYKPRRVVEPSSPGRETTVSPSATASTTTPGAAFHDAMSPLSLSAGRRISDNCVLPTLPSTADTPMIVQLPDLQESKILLSPCLINDHEPTQPIKGFLALLSASTSSFQHALDRPDSAAILASTAKDTKQLALLVKSHNSEPTRRCMWSLSKNLSFWHPISVAVWDWKMLEAMFKGAGGGNEEEKKIVNDLFYANMEWNAEWEGQGAVEVTWRDGLVDTIPKRNIERMRECSRLG